MTQPRSAKSTRGSLGFERSGIGLWPPSIRKLRAASASDAWQGGAWT